MDCFGIKMKTQMRTLLMAVREKNKDKAYEWKNSDTWSTLEHLLEANSTTIGWVSEDFQESDVKWAKIRCNYGIYFIFTQLNFKSSLADTITWAILLRAAHGLVLIAHLSTTMINQLVTFAVYRDKMSLFKKC